MAMRERTCERPTGHWQGARDLRPDPTVCADCGSPASLHPVRICGVCSHRVDFHGDDADGCARMTAGEWCGCGWSFGRKKALKG
jgi:predicted amidophosphoribosyltransferase